MTDVDAQRRGAGGAQRAGGAALQLPAGGQGPGEGAEHRGGEACGGQHVAERARVGRGRVPGPGSGVAEGRGEQRQGVPGRGGDGTGQEHLPGGADRVAVLLGPQQPAHQHDAEQQVRHPGDQRVLAGQHESSQHADGIVQAQQGHGAELDRAGDGRCERGSAEREHAQQRHQHAAGDEQQRRGEHHREAEGHEHHHHRGGGELEHETEQRHARPAHEHRGHGAPALPACEGSPCGEHEAAAADHGEQGRGAAGGEGVRGAGEVPLDACAGGVQRQRGEQVDGHHAEDREQPGEVQGLDAGGGGAGAAGRRAAGAAGGAVGLGCGAGCGAGGRGRGHARQASAPAALGHRRTGRSRPAVSYRRGR